MEKTSIGAALAAALLVCGTATAEADGSKYHLPGDQCEFADKNTGKLKPEMAKVYVRHLQFEIYRLADKKCTGELTPEEIQAYLHSKDADLQVMEYSAMEREARGKPITLDAKSGQPTVALAPNPTPNVPTTEAVSGWNFLLRDSTEDIGVWQRPKKAALAGGAQFGFSSDAAAANESWAAKGVATVVYSWLNNRDSNDPGVVGFAFAPWASFNRLTNSNTSSAFKSKQLDVLSLGGTTELGYRQSNFVDHYVRLKGGVNTDFEFNVRSWTAAAEWQPVSNQYGLSAPIFLGQPFTLQIDPIARLQTIQRVNGSHDPIFTEHDRVWRAGPVISLVLQPAKDESGDGILPKFLQSAAFNLSYSALFDTYTGKDYYLLNTSLNVPFPGTENVGAKLSYARGYDDQTATWTDQFLIGLSAKW